MYETPTKMYLCKQHIVKLPKCDIIKVIFAMQERVITMTYITREDGITALPLSNRAANCLRREGLHTIGDMLDYARKHNWLDLHSIGDNVQ